MCVWWGGGPQPQAVHARAARARTGGAGRSTLTPPLPAPATLGPPYVPAPKPLPHLDCRRAGRWAAGQAERRAGREASSQAGRAAGRRTQVRAQRVQLHVPGHHHPLLDRLVHVRLCGQGAEGEVMGALCSVAAQPACSAACGLDVWVIATSRAPIQPGQLHRGGVERGKTNDWKKEHRH